MIIAIDGPSGAGKSTVARALADRLGIAYLDTGAMYRAVAYKALQQALILDDDGALGALAQTMTIDFVSDHGANRVIADEEDVTQAIRTPEVDRAVSPVSAAPSVRDALTDMQRRIGAQGDYVVEGRDIATTVFPNAELKVFLTASAEERARRRFEQNRERGIDGGDEATLLAAIVRRDQLDSSREASPLRQAEDARLLDSTNLSQEAVIEQLVAWAQEL